MEHIGFIVDGNRRWAKERGLPTLEGHTRGYEKVEDICEALTEMDVKYASFYIFSTENWGRSEEEVSYLMKLLDNNIPRLAKKMKKNNAKVVVLGYESRVDEKLLKKIRDAEELTKDCTGLTVCLCFNYGGHQEILDASKALALEYKDVSHANMSDPSKIPSADDFFTIENLAKHIYHPEVPPVDMIVRTSGEQRISGFMLWRSAYSEFLFLDKYWPDIETSDLEGIFKEYESRGRRFGK
ncbi:MAG: polyprenyl diphosphate synthase [Candidatus Saccharibacteria bacterium]|nr:polyprenyl diphosphate synthase [Candidatus Saccharibacteria bacterium]